MFTNVTGIPLSIAAWLATDDYDHSSDPKEISATTLLQPVRSVVLQMRAQSTQNVDLSSLIPSRLGTAVHDSIEQVWRSKRIKQTLLSLGLPEKVAGNVVVNPEKPEPGNMNVHMEVRSKREVLGYVITGKYDLVLNGQLEDHKTTKTYSYIKQSNKDSYIKQGSLYRWLNPLIITKETVAINYIFTDWIQMKTLTQYDYPKKQVIQQHYPLMTMQATQQFVEDKIREIDRLVNLDQKHLPQCSREELWQQDAVYKYYKNPSARTRSTKNFDNLADAHQRLASDGNIGTVVTVPGQVKRCHYCNASPSCTQRESLEAEGLLKT